MEALRGTPQPSERAGEDERLATIARLRSAIPGLNTASNAVSTAVLPAGHPELAQAFAGWPRPGLSELTGPLGSGRLSLLRPAVAALIRRRATLGVVDPLGAFHPPGWPELEPGRLVLVRPEVEQACWAAEQLARSGAMPLVILLDPPRSGGQGARLCRAAEQGGSSLVVVSTRSDKRLPVALRVQVMRRDSRGVHVRALSRRGGRLRSGVLPGDPIQCDQGDPRQLLLHCPRR